MNILRQQQETKQNKHFFLAEISNLPVVLGGKEGIISLIACINKA